MTYKVDRSLGFQQWGVTNPWVFANFGQPQRQRGTVSPMVFQTHPPRLMNDHLGRLGQDSFIEEDRARARRMEWVAYASLGLSAWSLWFFYDRMTHPKAPVANKGRRRAKRRRGKRA